MKDMTTGSPHAAGAVVYASAAAGHGVSAVLQHGGYGGCGQIPGGQGPGRVGSTGSINFLVLGLCNGICAGFAIPVAQKFGQRDFDGLRKFVGNMIWLSVFFAAAITW